jgi:hypothetical protein
MLHFVFVDMQCMLLSKEFSKDVFYSIKKGLDF